MPYIPRHDRERLMMGHAPLPEPVTGGELCYLMALLCRRYLEGKGASYATFGEVRHALASVWDAEFAAEFAQYEHGKAIANGGV